MCTFVINIDLNTGSKEDCFSFFDLKDQKKYFVPKIQDKHVFYTCLISECTFFVFIENGDIAQ